MTKIQGSTTQQVKPHDCGPNDTTSPPTPSIVRSMAFDRAKADATVQSQSGGGVGTATRDPAYIELGNVEVGTKFELLNLSANPSASFDSAEKIVLEPTGRDPTSRTAAIYIGQEQLEKLGLKPGDMYQLRAVDNAGNASAPVVGELQGNEWATGRVVEDGQWAGRGAQLSALDGEAQRKNLVAKAVNDARPPVVQEAGIAIVTKDNGHKEMVFDRALEPQAQVTVQNSRTGAAINGRVDDQGKLTLGLKDVVDGDPLLVSVTDNNGVRGQDVEIVFSSKCKDGKAPKLKGGLSARLPGVI